MQNESEEHSVLSVLQIKKKQLVNNFQEIASGNIT